MLRVIKLRDVSSEFLELKNKGEWKTDGVDQRGARRENEAGYVVVSQLP